MRVPVAGQEQVEGHGVDEFAIPDLDGGSVQCVHGHGRFRYMKKTWAVLNVSHLGRGHEWRFSRSPFSSR